MEKKYSALNLIKIASPCTENWNDMHGDAQTRHCDSCHKNVYNISEMTANEAESFLQANIPGRCLRLYRRADGTVITKDCGTQKTPFIASFAPQFASFGSRLAAVFGLAVGATMIPHASATEKKTTPAVAHKKAKVQLANVIPLQQHQVTMGIPLPPPPPVKQTQPAPQPVPPTVEMGEPPEVPQPTPTK